jgi:DNA-binding transcriptional ArsR family regulator
MPKRDSVATDALLFAALSDPTRLRVVTTVAHRGSATASELARLLLAQVAQQLVRQGAVYE